MLKSFFHPSEVSILKEHQPRSQGLIFPHHGARTLLSSLSRSRGREDERPWERYCLIFCHIFVGSISQIQKELQTPP